MGDLVVSEDGRPPKDDRGQPLMRRWRETRPGEWAPEIAVNRNLEDVASDGGLKVHLTNPGDISGGDGGGTGIDPVSIKDALQPDRTLTISPQGRVGVDVSNFPAPPADYPLPAGQLAILTPSGEVNVGNTVSVQGAVTVTNPTPAPETGLAKTADVQAIRDRLPGALHADGGVLAHIQNWPSSWPVTGTVTVANMVPAVETGLAKDTSVLAVRDRLPTAPDADGGLKVHVTNPGAIGGGSAAAAPDTYLVMAQNVAFATNKHHLTIINGVGSGKVMKLQKLFAINLSIAAVTGVAVRFDVKRATSSTLGTGSTVVPEKMDSLSPNVPAQILLHTNPTTVVAGNLLFPFITNNDEVGATNAFPTSTIMQGLNLAFESMATGNIQPLVLREGQGITVQQITATTVGSFAWMAVFTLE